MTVPSLSRQRLIDLTAGHPLAMEALRQYDEVIKSAIAICGPLDGSADMFERSDVLKKALRVGGWIE